MPEPNVNPSIPHTIPEPGRGETPGGCDLTTPHAPAAESTDAPATVTQPQPAPPRAPGLPDVPGYHLYGELARGGMGVVYAALDLSLDREVAVKTLLPQYVGRTDLTSQFDREARITARLPHPGVPPVHALGALGGGSPFLAMKLIRGKTLAALLRERPNPAHELPRWVQVFEQIAQTVGFAHSVGVIHRDLKPSNVMVGGFGEVQVMDWGLAKSGDKGQGTGDSKAEDTASLPTDHSPLSTAPGQVKGTPAFMPPEQARGEWDLVDARADVFALGGILCVILTGSPPYVGSTNAVVLARAVKGELETAFDWLDACGADPELITLCKRCLSANPADRPADGQAVAAVVAAYRASVEERARRAETQRAAAEAEAREQRKRRKVQLALAGSLALLLVAGGAFAWWQDRQTQEENRKESERQAERAREELVEQVRRDENARVTGELLDRCRQALAAGLAEDAAATLTDIDARIKAGVSDEVAARAAAYRIELDCLRDLQRASELQFRQIGDKANTRKSETIQQEALGKIGIVPGKTPAADAARRVNAAAIREHLILTLDQQLPILPGSLEILRLADPDPYRNEVRASLHPFSRERFAVLVNQGAALEQPAHFAVVLASFTNDNPARRLRILRQAYYRQPADLRVLTSFGLIAAEVTGTGRAQAFADLVGWSRAAVAANPRSSVAWYGLAWGLAETGQPAEAALAARKAVDLHSQNAHLHGVLGEALYRSGQFGDAVAAFRRSLELDPNVAGVRSLLGRTLIETGQRAAALVEFREVVRLDPNRVADRNRLAKLLYEFGEHREAIEEFRAVTRLDPKDATAFANLAVALVEVGQASEAAEAVKAAREAVRLDPKLAQAHRALGVALQATGDEPGATAAFQEATRLGGPQNWAERGAELVQKGEYAAAIPVLQEAIKLDPKNGLAHNDLGRALERTGKVQEAIAAHRMAIKLEPRSPRAHHDLGYLLIRTGEKVESIRELRIAVRLSPISASLHQALGYGLLQVGDLAEAIECLRQAIRLDPKLSIAHNNLARALIRVAKHEEAIAAAQTAIRLEPGNPFGHFHLAQAYAELGRIDESIASLREAARLDQRPPEVNMKRTLDAMLRLRAGPRLYPVVPLPREVSR